MGVQTGRTVGRYVTVHIDDSSSTLRQIPVSSISGLGLTYEETELTAFQDAIKGVLNSTPDFSCTISGPFDTTANTGSHTVLSGVVGLNVPLTFDVKLGMRQTYVEGEPQFGVTATTANGVLVTAYDVDPGAGTYTAKIRMASGSAAPAWGVASET
jgi:hypothetical protein